jgi:hypothetical protein
MCEAHFEVPPDYVSAHEQARAQGLLMIDEAAKLLNMLMPDLILEAGSGRIEITARCNNLPCFSLEAIDAYRQHQSPQAS